MVVHEKIHEKEIEYDLEVMMNEEMESISQSISDIAEYFGFKPHSLFQFRFTVSLIENCHVSTV